MNLPDGFHKVIFASDNPVNTSDEQLLANVSTNIRRQLPQAKPHLPNPDTIALVCGGPSLAQTEKELVEAVWGGAKIAAVNGAYKWCIDRNLKPSIMIMLDARAFNARFLATPVAGCRYLLAAQCHPDAFDLCADRDVTIWHAIHDETEYEMLKAYYFGNFQQVTLGSSVGIRAITLLRMLGFQSFDIFGFDSCVLDDKHHGYAQPENDEEKQLEVWLHPHDRIDMREKFICTVWQMKQVEEFQQLIRERGDTFRLNVRGPGIIATMMRVASKLGINNMKLTATGDTDGGRSMDIL